MTASEVWRKSSWTDSSNCVEVSNGWNLRDSKERSVVLRFGEPGAVRAFVAEAKAGRFDR